MVAPSILKLDHMCSYHFCLIRLVLSAGAVLQTIHRASHIISRELIREIQAFKIDTNRD